MRNRPLSCGLPALFLALALVTACSDGGKGENQALAPNLPTSAPSLPPVEIVDSDNAANTVSESAAIGSEVGITVEASGGGTSVAATYALTGSSLFTIDSASGVVRTAQALDFEASASHQVTITGRYPDGRHSSELFVIEVIDIPGPTLSLSFPLTQGVFRSSEIDIRGFVSGIEGNTLEVSVSSATIQRDASLEQGSGEWIVENFPTGEGDLAEIKITAVDTETGEESSTAIRLDLQAPLVSPRAIAFDPQNKRAVILDERDGPDAIISVDINTGKSAVISDSVRGSGPKLEDIRGLALDLVNDRVLVVDAGSKVLASIDLASGDRRVISENFDEDLVRFASPNDLVYDPKNNRAIVADKQIGSDAILGVDLSDGSRTVIFSGGNDGERLTNIVAIALDLENNNVLVVDDDRNALFQIDLRSAEHRVLSSSDVGDGVMFEDPSDLIFDGENNRVLIVNDPFSSGSEDDALFAVDVASGNREVISAKKNRALGAVFRKARGLALDADINSALVVDSDYQELMTVDLRTGVRSFLSSSSASPSFRGAVAPEGITMDLANNRALIVDEFGKVASVDLNNGRRRILSNYGRLIFSPDIALDAANNRALLLDPNDLVYSVSLESGLLDIIANPRNPSTVSLPFSMAMDSINNQLLISEYQGGTSTGVIAVDLNTGSRSFISDERNGEGPLFSRPSGITFNPLDGSALVVDANLDALIEVDLSTGERILRSGKRERNSDETLGSGIALFIPDSLDLDVLRNQALVGDTGHRALLSIDLDDGSRSVVSSASEGAGHGFGKIEGVAVDAENSRAFILDSNFHLMVVDLRSGDRVVLSF